MKHPILMRGVGLAAALGICGGFAQTRPDPTDSGKGVAPAVMSDIGPPPAQERDSLGAIVLYDSMVRAQRPVAFESSASRTGIASLGRRVLRATLRAQREADLAQAREKEAVEFYRRGTGVLEQ